MPNNSTSMCLRTPEKWEALLSRMRAAGVEMPEEPCYEGMKAFVESDDYTLEVDLGQNWLPRFMIEASERMLFYLSRRHWSLNVVATDAPDLICSDNPVSLTETPASPAPGMLGFASFGTMLLFPLNRRMALVGTFDGSRLPSPAEERIVALINGATGRYAERFLFSSTPGFPWLDRKQRVRAAADLVALIQKQGRPRSGPAS